MYVQTRTQSIIKIFRKTNMRIYKPKFVSAGKIHAHTAVCIN
jgi:hypothetical protein